MIKANDETNHSKISSTVMRRTNLTAAVFLMNAVLANNSANCQETLTPIAHQPKPIHVAQFSKNKVNTTIPDGWQKLTFPSIEKHSSYSIVSNNNILVVKAVSHGGASGISKKVDIDPAQFPIIKWRWNIDNLIKKADINSKSGDDYPARLYITFYYDINKLSSSARFKAKMYAFINGELPPLASIIYIWDNKTAINSIKSSVYSDFAKMIVVQSGASKLQQWLSEERNIVADYIAAFGEKPSRITGIAIMTDTDNTGEKATAYFGDISFYPVPTAKSK